MGDDDTGEGMETWSRGRKGRVNQPIHWFLVG